MPLYELLVRTQDKTHPDPEQNMKCFKKGDVIALKLSSEAWWTERERTNPNWTILKVELTEQQAAALLTPELPPDLNHKYIMLRQRAVSIDLDAIANKKQGDLVPSKDLLSSLTIKERKKELFEL